MSGRVSPTSAGRSLGDAWAAIRELQRKPPPAASGGSSLPVFTNTSFNITIDDSPLGLNASTHYDRKNDDDGIYFDSASGWAQIEGPGFYVIGQQVEIESTDVTSGDTYVASQLAYAVSPFSGLGSYGYGIEVPWVGFGLAPPSGTGEQILGTNFTFPDATPAGVAVALQRLHPVSFLDDMDFPIRIVAQVYCGDTSGIYTVRNAAVWGFRVGDPFDSFHSD